MGIEITKNYDKSNIGESGSKPRAKTILVTENKKRSFTTSLRMTGNTMKHKRMSIRDREKLAHQEFQRDTEEKI